MRGCTVSSLRVEIHSMKTTINEEIVTLCFRLYSKDISHFHYQRHNPSANAEAYFSAPLLSVVLWMCGV